MWKLNTTIEYNVYIRACIQLRSTHAHLITPYHIEGALEFHRPRCSKRPLTGDAEVRTEGRRGRGRGREGLASLVDVTHANVIRTGLYGQ